MSVMVEHAGDHEASVGLDHQVGAIVGRCRVVQDELDRVILDDEARVRDRRRAGPVDELAVSDQHAHWTSPPL
jgi:hypothetical protein